MTDLPFSVSPEAMAWLVDVLREAETQKEFAGLVPVLGFSSSSFIPDPEGEHSGGLGYSSFYVGLYRPEQLINEHCRQLNISGFTLLADAEVLQKLEDKQLVLETVELSYATGSGREWKLLRATPLSGDKKS
jgi:hypothetical protein